MSEIVIKKITTKSAKKDDPFKNDPLPKQPKTLEEANPQTVEDLVKTVKKSKITKPKQTKPKAEKPETKEQKHTGKARNLLINRSGKNIRYYDLDSKKFVENVSDEEEEQAKEREDEMIKLKNELRSAELRDLLLDKKSLCIKIEGVTAIISETEESKSDITEFIRKMDKLKELSKLMKLKNVMIESDVKPKYEK
jgi:hypothetical protein